MTHTQTGAQASPEALLDFSVAVIELYFRLEAATEAIAGFAHAGGEWGVLRGLVRDGPQTVPQIARARPISRQHCQTIVNRLVEQGLAELIPNPRHKRSVLVRPTKSGRAWLEDMTGLFLRACEVYAPRFAAKDMALATSVVREAHAMLET